jgi:hypothetical protein
LESKNIERLQLKLDNEIKALKLAKIEKDLIEKKIEIAKDHITNIEGRCNTRKLDRKLVIRQKNITKQVIIDLTNEGKLIK